MRLVTVTSITALAVVVLMVACGGDAGTSDEYDAYVDSGIAYDANGESQLAIKEFTKAILLHPDFPAAYVGRAATYEDLGETQLAIEDYNKGLSLDADNQSLHPANRVDSYMARGLAYLNLGEYQRAVQDSDKSIQLLHSGKSEGFSVPESVKPVNSESWARAQDSREWQPTATYWATAYSNRGLAYVFLGEFSLALKDLNEAIRLDPTEWFYYDIRGNVHKILGNHVQQKADEEKRCALNSQYCED